MKATPTSTEKTANKKLAHKKRASPRAVGHALNRASLSCRNAPTDGSAIVPVRVKEFSASASRHLSLSSSACAEVSFSVAPRHLANGLNPEPDAAFRSIFTGLRLSTSNEPSVEPISMLVEIVLAATLFGGLAAARDGATTGGATDAAAGRSTDDPPQPMVRAQQETTATTR